MSANQIVKFNDLDPTTQKILKEAVEARTFAYCPYSKFQVGACLLCEDGSIYRGCNVENSAFTVGTCAERAAFFKAIGEAWVAAAPDGSLNRAYCKYCKVLLTTHKKSLMDHGKTAKHLNKMQMEKSAETCRKLDNRGNLNIFKQQKITELKISIYIAEHSSIRSVDHLGELMSKLDVKSEIFTKLKLHRTKCTMLIKNVIAPCMLSMLIEDVGDSLFSIIVDESTDISNTKNLCVMLRYFSTNRKKIITTFYRIIEVEKCNAEGLFTTVNNQMTKDGLKINNCIGIGVDGASVMVGVHNSFSTLFKRANPDIVTIKCICHSLHLCAEYACQEMPRQLEFLVKEINNYFCHSPKRMTEYTKMYSSINNKKPLKIPKLSGTRWLARQGAISKILNQWEELRSFFAIASKEDKCYSADQILKIMDRPIFKTYLIFLKNILQEVCRINTLFQSDNISPFILFQDLFLFYKNLLTKIVVPGQLQKVPEVELLYFDFEKHVMHIDAIYYGYECQMYLNLLSEAENREVKERCRNFLIKLSKEIQKRLPENLDVLQKINVFNPTVATSQQKPNIVGIITCFRRFPVDETLNEWNNISNKQWRKTDDPVNFWVEVYEDTDCAENQRFKNISTLALSLLSLPISNATVERAFSIYNVIKNKLRNRLLIETVQAIMMIRFFLSIDNLSCISFSPSEEMLRKFTVSMYDKKKDTEDEEESEIINLLTL